MIHHRHRLWNSKVQLLSELLLPKAVIERFVRNPQGSLSAMRMPTGALTRTKWALIGFTKTLSIELGEFGIRANAILPGAAEGPRIQRVLEDRAKLSGKSVEEEKKSAMSAQSLQRFVDPRDIATLAVVCARYPCII